jgi:hypothetical protein
MYQIITLMLHMFIFYELLCITMKYNKYIAHFIASKYVPKYLQLVLLEAV